MWRHSSSQHTTRSLFRFITPAGLALVAVAVLVLGSGTPRSEASVTGAGMSLSINGQTGTVQIEVNTPFTVTVDADSIPEDGYIAAETYVDFGDTGLTAGGNPQAIWPDCDAPLLTGTQGNADWVGCGTGIINPQLSDHKGGLFTFDGGCNGVYDSHHTIQLLSYGHPDAGTLGAYYYSDEAGITPADHSGDFVADEIEVVCTSFTTDVLILGTIYEKGGELEGATLTVAPPGQEATSSAIGTFSFLVPGSGTYTITVKSPSCCYEPTVVEVSGLEPTVEVSIYPDTDGDGCNDFREKGSDETQGGLRDYTNPYDFYDVPGLQGEDPDGVIDLSNDILGVINHYAPTGAEPAYDAAFDRGPTAGPNPWNMTAPDGVIDLSNDVLGVINQHGHDCR